MVGKSNKDDAKYLSILSSYLTLEEIELVLGGWK